MHLKFGLKFRSLYQAAAAVGFMLAAPACAHPHSTPSPQPNQAAAAVGMELGPALWKVADEDTTIYLFGTVHVLPDGIQWFDGQIKSALAKSDTLVTEVDTRKAAEQAPKMIAAGTLPKGQTLRSLLTKENRTKYEAALGKMGIPPDTFDQYEPWFAGLQLSMMPLLMDGWNPESGVESVLFGAAGEGKNFDQLETAQFQINMFDTMPQAQQIDYFNQIVTSLPETKATVDSIVKGWVDGDPAAIGEIVSGSGDDAMYKLVFSDRNANWAGWIDDRMETPGTVFVAVGAGHLAGKNSVQDYLTQRGITVTRLQ